VLLAAAREAMALDSVRVAGGFVQPVDIANAAMAAAPLRRGTDRSDPHRARRQVAATPVPESRRSYIVSGGE